MFFFINELTWSDPIISLYHSWQRETNENTNGLIRQYFPKSINFDLVRNIEVKRVMDKLNRRPRKTLDFKTPSEVFACG